MGRSDVKRFFDERGLPVEMIQSGDSTATVEAAARALGVSPRMIAKTLAFRLRSENVLIVIPGDVKVDRAKFKAQFGERMRFLDAELVESETGHQVGGVCPFGLKKELKVYLDVSLKRMDCVYPSGGSTDTSVRMSVELLQSVTKGVWVDVCIPQGGADSSL